MTFPYRLIDGMSDAGRGLSPAGGHGVGQRGVIEDGLSRVAGAEVGYRLLEPGRSWAAAI